MGGFYNLKSGSFYFHQVTAVSKESLLLKRRLLYLEINTSVNTSLAQ